MKFVCDGALKTSCLQQYAAAYPDLYKRYLDTYKSDEFIALAVPGLNQLAEYQKNDPLLYRGLIKTFGSDSAAALAIGLVDRYENDPSLVLDDLGRIFIPGPGSAGFAIPEDTLEFGKGTVNQVIVDLKELVNTGGKVIDAVRHPLDTVESVKAFINYVKEDPERAAKALGTTSTALLAQLDEYGKRIQRDLVIYTAARITGDDTAAHSAAYALGQDVGALVVEGVTGEIVAKGAIKVTVKATEKVSELYDAYKVLKAAKAAEVAVNNSIKQAVKILEKNGIKAPPTSSLDDVATREWYLAQEAKIPSLIDAAASLEVQARQAWALRNEFRTAARQAMSDRVAADLIDKTRPNLTWDQTVAKYKLEGQSQDDLWKKIIESSQKSDSKVNEKLGLKPPKG